MMFAGTGDIGYFCGLDNIHVLPVFRHDYSRVLFCLDPSWSLCNADIL